MPNGIIKSSLDEALRFRDDFDNKTSDLGTMTITLPVCDGSFFLLSDNGGLKFFLRGL